MAGKNTFKFYTWIAILAFGVMVGLYGVAMLLSKGHGEALGTSDQVPWGIFIAGFAFFIGASAGATIIGLMIHGFGREGYKPLGIRALVVGILSLMAAMIFIVMDVGNVPKMTLIPWVLRNPTSMFMYTATTYYLFGLLLLGELYFGLKLVRGTASDSDKKTVKWLAIAAVPFALWVLHAPHGALFGVIKAREFWNTPLLPPLFAASALVTGTAIMTLIAVLTPKVNQKELVSKETLDHLGKLLAGFITLDLFFDFFDALVLNYSWKPDGAEAWNILTGDYASLYALNIGGLVVALLILLYSWSSKQGFGAKGLFVASLLSIGAIAAYRYNLAIVGQLVPLWQGQIGQEISYSPTGIEISITIGAVALVLLLYTVLTKVLPLEEK